MFIKAIRIEKFRHLENLEILPPSPGNQSSAIALAGPNGGGKTSILEVIAQALANSFQLNYASTRAMGQQAFEVDLGFTARERDLVSEAVSRQPQSFVKEEVESFVAEGWYTRFFNRQPLHSEAGRHDRAHNLVQSALHGVYGRPVGFSIRADRSYPNIGFQQQTLLQQPQLPIQRNANSAYQLPEMQYRDMLDFLIEVQYHHLINVGRHIEEGGKASQRPANPTDPYNALLESLMPGYSIATLPGENTPTNLYIRIPNGEMVPFSDLSSGEREVFFVLATFIRQDVSDAIITVDEPELHLHPELSRKLIRLMTTIKPGNQIWLATHNGEVFDEVGLDRTFYVQRNEAGRAQVTPATQTSRPEVLLRELFGYSGYIGVAKSLLFLEGEESSLDRRVFTRLFPDELADVKLIPSGGVESVIRIMPRC